MSKIICFDVNGTLVKENSWSIFTNGDEEIEKEIQAIFGDYYTGKMTIDDSWAKMVAVLRRTGRANQNFFYNCWDETSTFKEGAEEVIEYLKKKKYKIYLISCSIDIYLDCIAKRFNLSGFYAGSHLIFDANGEIEKITSDCIKGKEFKKDKLKELAEKEKVNLEDIIFVGDGDNDIGVFQLTKHGIAMGDNERLLNCCWKKIKSLEEIKEIL